MKSFILVVLFFAPSLIFASLDPHQAVKEILGFNGLPRPLNTIDFEDANLPSVQTLTAPEGDFNKDGKPDLAVAGIFDDPAAQPYFLLIATYDSSLKKYRRIYWRVHERPFLIHLPGTTGPGDPGTQAISYSFCAGCAKGFDVFWDEKKGEFISKAWEKRRVAVSAPSKPEPTVSEGDIDLALKIAGVLPEVQQTVDDIQKRNGSLATRVTKDKKGVWVWIIEKGEPDRVWRRVLIDLEQRKAIKIDRKKGEALPPG